MLYEEERVERRVDRQEILQCGVSIKGIAVCNVPL